MCRWPLAAGRWPLAAGRRPPLNSFARPRAHLQIDQASFDEYTEILREGTTAQMAAA